jgi:hypothetical protein
VRVFVLLEVTVLSSVMQSWAGTGEFIISYTCGNGASDKRVDTLLQVLGSSDRFYCSLSDLSLLLLLRSKLHQRNKES